MRRTLLAVFTIVAMMTLLAGPALAQYPPLPADGAEVSDTTLVPGEAFALSGSGWLPGSTVGFTLFSDPVSLGSAEVGADTAFSAELEIPEDTEPGTHTLEIAGTSDEGDPRVVELTLEVLGASSDDGAGAAGSDDVGDVEETTNELAYTGANLVGGVGLAVVLLLAGGITLLVARRRRRTVLIEQ